MEDEKSVNINDLDYSQDDKYSDRTTSSDDEEDIECQEKQSSRSFVVPPLDLSDINHDLDFEAPHAPRVPEPAGEWGGVMPRPMPAMPAGVADNLTENHITDNIGIAGLNALTNSHSS